MRTPKQVKDEIQKLKSIKPTVRPTSFFGDNHHDAIDAQIEVLEDLLDEDEIYHKEDDEEWTESVRGAACEAYEWLHGNKKESIADEWKELVIP